MGERLSGRTFVCGSAGGGRRRGVAFDCDDRQRGEMGGVLANRAAHGEYPDARFGIARNARHEAKGSQQAFVLKEAYGLEEAERQEAHVDDVEAFVFEEDAPLGARKRPDADADGLRHFAFDFVFPIRGNGVWSQANLVEAIASARFEQAGGFGDDTAFMDGGLHGEHGLSEDDGSAGIRKGGFFRGPVYPAPCGRLKQARDVPRRGVIALHGRVRGGIGLQGHAGREAKSWRKFDDVVGRMEVECGQELAREFDSARTQHPLAESGKEPMAGHSRRVESFAGNGQGFAEFVIHGCLSFRVGVAIPSRGPGCDHWLYIMGIRLAAPAVAGNEPG